MNIAGLTGKKRKKTIGDNRETNRDKNLCLKETLRREFPLFQNPSAKFLLNTNYIDTFVAIRRFINKLFVFKNNNTRKNIYKN